jgi:hypothetical protein
MPLETTCKACGKALRFIDTAAGKSMPVDADTCSDDDGIFDPKRHVSHFVTCTDPDRFRKKKPKG